MASSESGHVAAKQAYQIHAIPAFTDNYIWCMHTGKNAVVVDPGDPAPVLAFLHTHNLALTDILITHHHYDHTGGIQKLLEAFPNIDVYGPNNPTIKGITKHIKQDDTVNLTGIDACFDIIEIPGHTLDHIGYVTPSEVFCGDTLFSAGCGRMFEGTPSMFYESLQKLVRLPKDTKVYCTHEYTLANLRFAVSVDNTNSALNEYLNWATTQRNNEQITLPTSIDTQIKINPFLRTDSSHIRHTINQQGNYECIDDVSTFAALRAMKDNF